MNVRTIIPYSPEELCIFDINQEKIYTLAQVQVAIWESNISTLGDVSGRESSGYILFQSAAIITNWEGDILTGSGGNIPTKSIVLAGSWAKTPLEIARAKLNSGTLSQPSNPPTHFCIWNTLPTTAFQVQEILGQGNFLSEQGKKRTPKRKFTWESTNSLLANPSIVWIDRLFLDFLIKKNPD